MLYSYLLHRRDVFAAGTLSHPQSTDVEHQARPTTRFRWLTLLYSIVTRAVVRRSCR